MPWSGEVAFLPTARRIFEYACHEDNSAIEGGLRGAREREGEEALRRHRSSGALLGAERGNRKIWRTWLPDIFLNPHGYPSHEWVQLFSEYAAWVRTRSVETRDYWTMRGWWMPGFGWLDDARYPRHKDEQMKLLNMITEYAKAAPGTVALNARAYDRYKRYSFDFDQKNFKLDFTNGVLIYKSIKGARANPQSPDFMTRNPNVTIWDGVTEAPDETARGDWLKLVANAGLQWDKAILEYLVQGRHEIERKVDPFWNGVSLTMNRPRPPKPPKTDDDKNTTSEQAR